MTSVVKHVFLRYYLSHSLDFYTIYKQLSGQYVQYRPARTALQQNPFPQKYTENSRFYHREHREQPFNHEVHEGNEDNTLSQCIYADSPHKYADSGFYLRVLRFLRFLCGKSALAFLCVFCAFALNRSLHSMVLGFPLVSLVSLVTPAQRATPPIQSNPLCLSRL